MRFATEPDADTDNSLSTQPEPERCETCGNDCEGADPFVRTSGGRYAFCSQSCFDVFEAAQEDGE